MRRWIRRMAMLALALAPAAASSDRAPSVVMATPGSGGGTIERFTVRFSEPMVPLGDPRAAGPFTVTCPVAGQGRWVDQTTFVHEFAGPLPGGISCAFDLRPGLRSLRGAMLTSQRFTVDTGGPAARAVLPSRYGGEIDEDQVFLVAANVVPRRASVAANAYCAVAGIGEKIAVDLLPPGTASRVLEGLGSQYAASSFLTDAGLPSPFPADPSARAAIDRAIVAFKCRRPLPPGQDMAIVWGGTISAANGRTAGADQRFDFTVRKAFEARFECSRINPRAGCNPVQDAWVRFTAPIDRAVAEKIRIELPNGRRLTPFFARPGRDERTQAAVSEVRFKGPLPAATAATVVLPEGVRDDSNRPLANAQRYPLAVRFDASPPLIKFAANFGIVEAKEGGMLPVTVRAVEPSLRGGKVGVDGKSVRVGGSDSDVARWLRQIEDAAENKFDEQRRGSETITVNNTGARSILTGAAGARPIEVPLPGRGKEFEVVGVPLARPGFYVVEFASPVLGRALLGRDAPRYVAAGALVTNMAVHFKWGREYSLAWVTALDSGAPVAGAAVAVTDSCSGRLLARGTTDRFGRITVRPGLPEPESYGSCEGENATHPLMVSARKDDDFSFTMTEWSDGIRPYDFDLSFGYEDDTRIFHTIFDRTLMRAGDTVNMKHILRRPVSHGFAFDGAMTGMLRLTHRGSGTQYDVPLSVGADGTGETQWTAPPGAAQGDYDLTILTGTGDDQKTIFTNQSIRVDEYRLPTMRASVTGPRGAAIRPRSLPLDLYVGYLSGGGAANMGVSLRTAFDEDVRSPRGYENFEFGGRPVKEGVEPLDGEGEAIAAPLPASQTIPATLDGQGAARTSIDIPLLESAATLTVEMDYQDANGETLTTARRIAIHPAAYQVGIRTDGWMMKADDLRLKLVVLDADGKPVAGKRVGVALYSREILSARRRLIGGFYAYDNNVRTKQLAANCSAVSDAQGLAECAIDPDVSGEVYAVASVRDGDGNVARAVRSVWLAGDEDWWFGGDNGDRMDVVPEQREYKSTDTARFQVRMPFREATALVTVEREGVIGSFVTTLSGKDPVISVPLQGAYAPDVYVSVMAVRGRVSGFRLWLANFAQQWNLPFFSREGARPTALVDLAKPAYRMGTAKIRVGWEGHRLGVTVRADRDKYRARDIAQIAVQVTDPSGRPPASAEIAFAAVDEALLTLAPNPSWDLIDAMMGERPLSVLTSTAQMQVVGKRHYGRKAVAAGGGGGGDLSNVNREDFRPVLLWRGRVPLDAQGRARIAVPLSDSLSSFRMVAVATAGPALFGTGELSVRTAQDLTVYAALPPVVRSGDFYGASFTLRNGSDAAMTVTANAQTAPRMGTAPPLTVTIPAGGAVPVTWNVAAPDHDGPVRWTVVARSSDGRAIDRLSATQTIQPAIPLETWAATLARIGPGTQIMLTPPAGALPGRGEVQVRLSSSLAPPLDGLRRYMLAYPYGCFEQRLSRAVVLGDGGAWARLAGEIPSYLDSDGLLRYFPGDRLEGDAALTAYVVSMTAEAGFTIPEGPRARMIEGLRGVIDGRIVRDYDSIGDQRFRRLAALAALARAGAATPAMIGAVGIPAAEMPTALLADWIVALDRTPGASSALKAEAERTLRSRIVYEGSRLDLTDAGSAPWWMMTSGDEMALKALGAVIGRPGWQDDAPRMMVGAALRQRRGHWDTTPANAWGAVVARRFAAMSPAEAVTGTTTASLGPATRSASWPAADLPFLRLPLPSTPMPLLLTQVGGAGPWAQVALTAAVPLQRPLFAGYRIARSVTVVTRRHPDRLTRGDVIRVRITVEASADRNWVVINDPIPAGATIVGRIGGQSQILADQADAAGDGFGPSYVERGADAWRGYYAWMPRGRTTVEYALRLNGTGRLQLPPTRVEAMYSPDIRGAVPNAPIVVGMR